MDDCLFCKIVRGDIKANEARSTERTYAFHDINKGAPTHVLVVPKEHIENAHEVRPEHAEIVAEMFTTAQPVAEAEGVAASGYRLVMNVGDDSGNSVPHLHLHVIGGRRMGWPPG